MKAHKFGVLIFFASALVLVSLVSPVSADVRFSTAAVEVPPTCQAYACGDNAEACKTCHLITESPPAGTESSMIAFSVSTSSLSAAASSQRQP